MAEKDRKKFFPKIFRRRAFIEISKGRNLFEILTENGYTVTSNDKKYIAKLSSKWKKEFFSNREMMNISSFNMSDEILMQEVVLMGDDKETDLMDFIYKNKRNFIIR